MSIDKLLSVLKAPEKPLENGTPSHWDEIERQIGISLPADYKVFINLFGTGVICNYLWVLNALSPNQFLALGKAPQIIGHYDVMIGEDNDFPYKLYPHKGGLLPCIVTESRSHLMWITVGQPDTWKLIWLSDYLEIMDVFEFSLTEFLYRFISGQIKNHWGDEEYVDQNAPFMNGEEYKKHNNIE
jgi:hypothetical protein